MLNDVMSNGRFIRKQIFFLLGLFFSCSNLSAMCPQTVGVVTPGESIWQVTSRIGQATNEIESQLCLLIIANSDFVCSFTFGQADIGGGGIYTISVPGTYCMSENVTFTFGPAITINSNDVTIEMLGHTLSGADNVGTVGIGLGLGVQNVIIKNGIIEHLAGVFPTGGIGIIDLPFTVNKTLGNITIQDMSFNNNSVSAISLNGASNGFSFDVEGLLIENCSLYNSGSIIAQALSAIVQGCELRGKGSRITLEGTLLGPLATSFLIQDCIVTGSFGEGVGSIFIRQVENGIVRNCISQGSAIFGFQTLQCANVVISDCIAQNSVFQGFYIYDPNPGAVLTIERCVAESSGTGSPFVSFVDGFHIETNGSNSSFTSLTLVDCIAQLSNGTGFFIQNEVRDWGNIIVKGCSASANGGTGFYVATANAVRLVDIVFEDCVAQNNSGDGFSLLNLTLGSLIQDVVFRNCVSQANVGGTAIFGVTFLGDGFGIGSPSANASPILDIVCQNCVAQNNAHDGFNFGSAANKIDTVSCQNCTAERNALHGMNFSSTSTNCQVYKCLMANNGGNGINNLNPIFGPSSANRFISNRSYKNTGVDYFQINNGINGQPFFSSSDEALIQGTSPWSNLST